MRNRIKNEQILHNGLQFPWGSLRLNWCAVCGVRESCPHHVICLSTNVFVCGHNSRLNYRLYNPVLIGA